MGSTIGDGVIKTKTRTKTQHKVWMILGRVRVDYEPNILYEILKAIQVFKGNYIHGALEEAFESPVWMSRLERWVFNLPVLAAV